MTSISIYNAAQILTPTTLGLPYLRHNRVDELQTDPGALTTADGLITELKHDRTADWQIDASGCTVIPGLVDAHTHLPFVGWREDEYALKLRGYDYEEIALRGGGINASARALAAATDEEVISQSKALALEMLAHGTTTFECKSGYGLSIDAELRTLRLANQLREVVPQSIVVTALLAHSVPQNTTADKWVDEIISEMPRIAKEVDIAALDIFVESIAFSNSHLMCMGDLAKKYELSLRCHVEQFATHRSIPVAIRCGARSVDHLACAHADDIAMLSQAECAAVLLPGAEFLGKERTPRASELARAGGICVLATDLNPGTSPIASLPLIMGLAARRYGWSAKAALLATTLNAAWVLGLSDKIGTIEPGKQADFLILDEPIDRIPYRFGHNPVLASFIAGRPAYIHPGAYDRLGISPEIHSFMDAAKQ